jgi:glutamyl-tRNA synthetase
MIELGVGETDISISMDTIYAENRKLIDSQANRYFFVWDPIELEIDGDVPKIAKAPLHPTIDRGFREIPAGNKVFVCRSDLEALMPGGLLRLKDFCTVRLMSKEPAKAKLAYVDPDQAKKDRFRIIHWAPRDALPVKVMKPDGIDEGVGEAGIARELGKVVQFERYGFVRINWLGDPIVAYFAHR